MFVLLITSFQITLYRPDFFYINDFVQKKPSIPNTQRANLFALNAFIYHSFDFVDDALCTSTPTLLSLQNSNISINCG